jgi:uncharacterized protein YndB with AHSA1/START domain
MVPNQIEREIVLDAPVERVWQIITEPEHIRRWFAFDGASIDLQPGGQIVLHWKEHGTYLARVVAVEPPHRFAYRGAYRPDEEPRDGNATLVEFTILPEGSGSRLRVVESGFRDLDLPEEERAKWAADNTQGWAGAFATLQAYLAELATARR